MAYFDLNTRIVSKPEYINGQMIISNIIDNKQRNRLFQTCIHYLDLRDHIDDDFLFIPINGEIINIYEKFISIADYINWLLKEVFTQSPNTTKSKVNNNTASLDIFTETKNKKSKNINANNYLNQRIKMHPATFASLTRPYKYFVIALNANISIFDNLYAKNEENRISDPFINIEFDNYSYYDSLGNMLVSYGFKQIDKNWYYIETNPFTVDESYYNRINKFLKERSEIARSDLENAYKDILCE